jgi:hypothetical protein
MMAGHGFGAGLLQGFGSKEHLPGPLKFGPGLMAQLGRL